MHSGRAWDMDELLWSDAANQNLVGGRASASDNTPSSSTSLMADLERERGLMCLWKAREPAVTGERKTVGGKLTESG